MGIPRTRARNEARQTFMEHWPRATTKVQFGARGKKFEEDWIAIDLFDEGPLIDHQWDIHCLPIASETLDVIDCNAILEHVKDPHLAVYEMHRCCRVGALAWIEVPFMQFYHAIPSDYCRWTVQGLELLLEDFEIVASGIGVNISHEVKKLHELLQRVFDDENVFAREAVTALMADYERRQHEPKLYSTAFCLVRKREPATVEKARYMEYRRRAYVEMHPPPYDPDVWQLAPARPREVSWPKARATGHDRRRVVDVDLVRSRVRKLARDPKRFLEDSRYPVLSWIGKRL